ncbi:hypothetical protein GCM10023331_00740 [Algivirga pacifica]|uniref:Uncharacterized protein n=2 Tax=Algivirga pacifica TaxID=1162670 RepID=A0ABP9CZ86_9BACT
MHSTHANKGRTTAVKIGFITEQSGSKLLQLLTPETLEELKRLNASVKISIQDLSVDKAEAVKVLQQNNIPVTAWILFPSSMQYWINADNLYSEQETSHIIQRYRDFQRWTSKHNLKWERIAFSITPYDSDRKVASSSTLNQTKVIWKRLLKNNAQEKANQLMAPIYQLIKQDGYAIDAFASPYELLAQDVASEGWHNLNHTFTVENARSIPLFFNHFTNNEQRTVALHVVYAQDHPAIAIGSLNNSKPLSEYKNRSPLSLASIHQHFHYAREMNKEVWIYGLKGAVQKNLLSRIDPFESAHHQRLDQDLAKRVNREGSNAKLIFQMMHYPKLILALLVIYLLLIGLSIRKGFLIYRSR